jgi:predicted membrane protein
MLWTVLMVLFVLWLLGLVAHIGSTLVHFLLVVALVLLVFEALSSRRVAL